MAQRPSIPEEFLQDPFGFGIDERHQGQSPGWYGGGRLDDW